MKLLTAPLLIYITMYKRWLSNCAVDLNWRIVDDQDHTVRTLA